MKTGEGAGTLSPVESRPRSGAESNKSMKFYHSRKQVIKKTFFQVRKQECLQVYKLSCIQENKKASKFSFLSGGRYAR